MSKTPKNEAVFPDLEKCALALLPTYFPEAVWPRLNKLDFVWNGRFQGKTAGVCRFHQDTAGNMTPFSIEVSKKYYLEYPELLETILLHEMIHAILPPFQRHGLLFRQEMNRINLLLAQQGEEGRISIRLPLSQSIAKTYRYFYSCTLCGQVYRRVKHPIQTKKSVCGLCRGKLTRISP